MAHWELLELKQEKKKRWPTPSRPSKRKCSSTTEVENQRVRVEKDEPQRIIESAEAEERQRQQNEAQEGKWDRFCYDKST